MKEKPTGITANKSARELTVTWADGHTSVYPFGLLRAACPCASCRGGHENMGQPADKDALYSADDPQINIENLEQVGSYALNISWNDGHWQGIYTWEYLYEACL